MGAINLGDIIGHATVNRTYPFDIIVGVIDQYCDVTLVSTLGSIEVKNIDLYSSVNLTANTTVTIDQKIDQQSTVIITAGGDVNIGQKI